MPFGLMKHLEWRDSTCSMMNLMRSWKVILTLGFMDKLEPREMTAEVLPMKHLRLIRPTPWSHPSQRAKPVLLPHYHPDTLTGLHLAFTRILFAVVLQTTTTTILLSPQSPLRTLMKRARSSVP